MDSNKKKWTIIGIAVAAVLAVIIGCTVAIVSSLNSSRNQQQQIARKMFGDSALDAGDNPSAGDGGKGSTDSDYTAIPDKLSTTAQEVVERIASNWRKLDDEVTAPSAADLQRFGMSKKCAENYKYPWDEVFAPAHTAGLQDVVLETDTKAAVQSVSGKKPNRVYVLAVSASLSPYYWDINGTTVRFPTEEDTWTVTVEESSGKVTKIVNPTPDQLGFRVPKDLVNEQQEQ